AGIAFHCHYHLVPRWSGDTNFITTIGETRVCGTNIEQVYQKLVLAFKNAQ
ncbi:HIT domain-containing protein, partial [Campylobacter jejuni]|nr:HIT domain-containing protein [Campylobacter jejuni]EAK3274426.1 HIT domain-containing protein [Campylobacter jejuni]